MITSRLITTDCDPYFSQNLPINFPSRQLPGYFARQCIIVWHVSGFGTSSNSRFRTKRKLVLTGPVVMYLVAGSRSSSRSSSSCGSSSSKGRLGYEHHQAHTDVAFWCSRYPWIVPRGLVRWFKVPE